MPHATDNTMASTINGDKSNSKFISHVTSYPIVHDTIDGFQANPYGKRSLELVDGAYQKFGKPVEPYLKTPYSYAKPYVGAADEIASTGLEKVDQHFPIMQQDTQKIVQTGKSYIFWPFAVAGNGMNYLLQTWNDEYRKTRSHNNSGDGVQTNVLALISTQLKVSSDFFQAVADYLGPKYEESKKKGNDLTKDLADTADKYKKVGQDKLSEATKAGQDKISQAQNTAQEKGEQVKQSAQQTKDDAQSKGEQVKNDAQSKGEQVKHDAQKKTSK